MKYQWTGSLTWITLLILLVAGFTLIGFTYPQEVQIVPLWIGFPSLILLVILWVGELFPQIMHRIIAARGSSQEKNSVGAAAVGNSSEFTGWRPVAVVICWAFLYFIFVFFFGFALVSPFFIAFFLVRKAQMRVPAAAIYSVIATALIYGLMTGLLASDLWSGAIPEIIPGILGGAIVPPL